MPSGGSVAYPGSVSRRQVLRAVGVAGLSIGAGPLVAGCAGNSSLAQDAQGSRAVAAGRAKQITILQTADVHAQLLEHDEFFWDAKTEEATYRKLGGYARIKTLVETVRRENRPGTLLVETGDCIQGGGVAALSRGAGLVPLLNDLRYDVMLPGNWEVVYGKKQLMQVAGGYTAPVVCTNMYHDVQGDAPGDFLFKPYWTTNMQGVKIGFVGYNDPMVPIRQSPSYSAGINFTQPKVNIAKYITLLREQERCDLVFVMTHLGLAQQVFLSNQEHAAGADYILGADTHERVRTPLEGKQAIVTEPGAFGSFVGRLDLVVEKGQIKDRGYQLMEVDPAKYEEDPRMRTLVDRARAPYRKELDRVLGETTTPLLRYFVLETPMDNLITDALRAKTGTDIALSNGFRFCPPLAPGPNGKATITKDYLWSMLPVNSQVKLGKVTGKQILAWWEKELENVFADDPTKRIGGWLVRCSGMTMNFTGGSAPGERVNWVRVGGAVLDPDAVYAVSACDREGDAKTTLCRLKDATEVALATYTLHEAVEEYLKQNSPVKPTVEGRITATDQSKFLLSQLPGTDYVFS